MTEFEMVFSDVLLKLTVKTTTPGAKNLEGDWVPGVPLEKRILSTAPQPISSNKSEPMIDGKRNVDDLVIHTPVELNSDNGGDKVVWRSREYLVTQVNRREEHGGFYRARISKILPGDA